MDRQRLLRFLLACVGPGGTPPAPSLQSRFPTRSPTLRSDSVDSVRDFQPRRSGLVDLGGSPCKRKSPLNGYTKLTGRFYTRVFGQLYYFCEKTTFSKKVRPYVYFSLHMNSTFLSTKLTEIITSPQWIMVVKSVLKVVLPHGGLSPPAPWRCSGHTDVLEGGRRRPRVWDTAPEGRPHLICREFPGT